MPEPPDGSRSPENRPADTLLIKPDQGPIPFLNFDNTILDRHHPKMALHWIGNNQFAVMERA